MNPLPPLDTVGRASRGGRVYLSVGPRQVLIAAGAGARQSRELYDPTSGTFSNTASLNVGRTDHSALLPQNGQATAVAGYNGNGENIGCLLSAEILDWSKSPICGSSRLSAAQRTMWSEQTFTQSTLIRVG